MENKFITIDDIKELMSKVPDGIELTFVGGQALSFWSFFYKELYPEEFQNRHDIVLGTADIDIVASSQAAKACAEAWGGRIYTPSPDDNTPNSAIVLVEIDG